jgi:signal transduction histidine kinase
VTIAMGDSNEGVRTAREGFASTASEGLPRDPFERLPALVFRRRPESPHPFVWIGGACAEIAGLPSHALTGDGAAWWEHVPSEDRERALAAMESAHARGSSYRIVYAYSSPAGSRRMLREEACAVFGDEGGVLGFEGIIVDVSEENAALARRLANETRIADLSRGFLALSAEKVDEGIRRSMAVVGALADADRSWLFSFDDSSPGIRNVYEWCLDGVEPSGERVRDATGERFPWAHRFLGAGEVLHVPDAAKLPAEAEVEREEMLRRGVRSMLGIPLLFGDQFIGYLGFETVRAAKRWSEESITILRLVGEILMNGLRRKRAEEELVDRQSQLLQAQKMEAVGTLAGGIAHDFNNQLTVMLGNARYAEARLGDDPNLREAMVDLTHSAEHCAQLTRSLLAFSRRSALSPASLDVAAIISKTEELIQPLIPSSIEIDVSFGRSVGPASADPNQLQQVLVNLVVNARDAMPDGGKIAIATANRRVSGDDATRIGLPCPGDYVEIAVRDDGTGMDEETCRRVFEPFFTTKAPGHGTGLGLAAAYGIMQESGGAIALESELGRGTTVRLLLPRSAVGSRLGPEGFDRDG